MKSIEYVPAEDSGGLKVKVFVAGKKLPHEGIVVMDIEHELDSGSVIVGSA